MSSRLTGAKRIGWRKHMSARRAHSDRTYRSPRSRRRTRSRQHRKHLVTGIRVGQLAKVEPAARA